MGKNSHERTTFGIKIIDILRNDFACVFFIPCELLRFIEVKIDERMNCLVCFLFLFLLPRGKGSL